MLFAPQEVLTKTCATCSGCQWGQCCVTSWPSAPGFSDLAFLPDLTAVPQLAILPQKELEGKETVKF